MLCGTFSFAYFLKKSVLGFSHISVLPEKPTVYLPEFQKDPIGIFIELSLLYKLM
jgi:hypothetical protein